MTQIDTTVTPLRAMGRVAARRLWLAPARVGLRRTAALALLGVALIHALHVSDQFGVWAPYGMAMIVIVTAQITLGAALLLQPWRYDALGADRPRADQRARPYYWNGVVVNVALVVLYVVSRAAGMPLVGGETGDAQPTTLAGVVASLGEGGAAACLLALLRREQPSIVRPAASRASSMS